MLILGIESSCDETAAAVVDGELNVRSNVIASQEDLHAEYGGVVPEIASRAHVERILPVIRSALRDANSALADIDAIAVGSRPGLIGSLVVGVAAAKALAWALGKPLIGVDHVHAHLIAGALDAPKPNFPALGLVVSGGHTSIYHCDSFLSLTRLGATIDDAVGEAYDKVAAMLALPYPGGPRLDALAQQGDDRVHDFPISRLGADSLDFSYSGLKTAVLYAVRGVPQRKGAAAAFTRSHEDLTENEKADIAASFQRAAIGAVIFKLKRALASLPEPPRTLLVGGGVSANSRLRDQLTNFARDNTLDLRLPEIEYCLDNAAMIAAIGVHKLCAGQIDDLHLHAVPTTAH